MVEPVGLAALALDAAIGWPAPLYRRLGHPVGGFARAIAWCERRFNRPAGGEAMRRFAGVVTLAALVGATVLVFLSIEHGLRRLLHGWWWTGAAILAWPAMAQRSLYDHVRPIAAALDRNDLPEARRRVAMIVGRDTACLDEAGIARAAVESLAESFCDGVVAPAVWLLLCGLPGIWAYKAVNTADSLIGHREPRWRAFGWAAARIDDLANLIPARLAAALICLAGPGGWRVLWRDGGRHASPNAGRPEAAMAGALGVMLAGPVAYDGILQAKPWIGDGREARRSDVRRALAVYLRACALLWLLAGAALWLR